MTMIASPGDRLVVKGHHVGEPDRDCEILEVHSTDGGPPYMVRWSDDGHEGLFFPGSDAAIEHFPAPKVAPAKKR
ncbi:MAG: DUF1918 domain-containing protein [Acidimicrobiales bacterium]